MPTQRPFNDQSDRLEELRNKLQGVWNELPDKDAAVSNLMTASGAGKDYMEAALQALMNNTETALMATGSAGVRGGKALVGTAGAAGVKGVSGLRGFLQKGTDLLKTGLAGLKKQRTPAKNSTSSESEETTKPLLPEKKMGYSPQPLPADMNMDMAGLIAETQRKISMVGVPLNQRGKPPPTTPQPTPLPEPTAHMIRKRSDKPPLRVRWDEGFDPQLRERLHNLLSPKPIVPAQTRGRSREKHPVPRADQEDDPIQPIAVADKGSPSVSAFKSALSFAPPTPSQSTPPRPRRAWQKACRKSKRKMKGRMPKRAKRGRKKSAKAAHRKHARK